MKKLIKYFHHKVLLQVFFLGTLSAPLAQGQIISMGRTVKTSPNPKTNPAVDVADMVHYNYKGLFDSLIEPTGGIIAEMSTGTSPRVELRMYTYDEDASDGKGMQIYHVYSDVTSEHWISKTEGSRLIPFGGVGGGHYLSSVRRDKVKKIAQNAKLYLPPSCSSTTATWKEMLRSNSMTPLSDSCKYAYQTQPVIIELTITDATLNKFKIPALGEFDAKAFFNFHEVIQEVLRNPNAHEDYIMVAAHRGYFRHQPENSLAAIQDAIDMGVDLVEIDVRPTKDGHLVLAHDIDLGRLTSIPSHILGHSEYKGTEGKKRGKYLLEKMNLADIRPDLADSPIPGHYSVRLKDSTGTWMEVIPTFKEALELCRGKVLVDVDKLEDPTQGGKQRFDLVFEDAQELAMTHQLIVKGRKGSPQVLRNEYPNVDWTQLKFTPVYFSDIVPEDENGNQMTTYNSVVSFLNDSSFNCPGVELIYRSEGDSLLGSPYVVIKSSNKHVIQFPQYPECAQGVWNPKKFQFSDIDPRHDLRCDWEWLMEDSRRPTLLISDRLELLMDLLEWRGLRSF